MAKNFNTNNFKYFVLLADVAAKGGLVSFSTYTDHANALGKGHGTGVRYTEGVDKKGEPRGKFFELSQSRRTFQVREGQKDINGISMYDFLKNSPECEGSPNLPQGAKPRFREMNDARDAEVALKSGKMRIRAAASALEIDDSTLKELAAHIGFFGESNDLMRHRVVEWAEKRPEDYFEVLESGDRSIRALIRIGLSTGILKKNGPIIKWEEAIIGNEEDSAVSKLMGDQDMLAALEERIGFTTKKEKPSKKTK